MLSLSRHKQYALLRLVHMPLHTAKGESFAQVFSVSDQKGEEKTSSLPNA